MPDPATNSLNQVKVKRSQAKPITDITKNSPQVTHKQAVILKTKTEHPDLTVREIAAIAECDHALVVRILKRYGIKQVDTDQFKRCRADILAGYQARILRSITSDDIKQGSLLQRVTANGILFDKERLERGQSTSNQSVMMGLSEGLQSSVDKIIQRVTVHNPVDNPITQPLSVTTDV